MTSHELANSVRVSDVFGRSTTTSVYCNPEQKRNVLQNWLLLFIFSARNVTKKFINNEAFSLKNKEEEEERKRDGLK